MASVYCRKSLAPCLLHEFNSPIVEKRNGQTSGLESMNSIVFARRRPVTTLILVVALIGGGALALNQVRPAFVPSKVYDFLDSIHLSPEQVKGFFVGHEREEHHEKPIRFWLPILSRRLSPSPRIMSARSIRSAISLCAP